jgi:predicted secreted protein
MSMSFVSLLAIYFVVWWVILFAVLPWGTRTQAEEGDIVLGSAHSAPSRPMLLRKALATSIVAAIIVGALWLAVERYGLSLEMLAELFLPVATQ